MFSRISERFFSNDIDVKVAVDPLLDDFGSNSIVFLLFPSLSSCGRVSSRFIYYIPDLFYLKHGLNKVGLLRPIFKVAELFFLALAIVVLFTHLTDLKKGKNVILAPVHTSDLIT